MEKININTTKEVIPQCYAYTTPGISYHDGWTKIGFTERDVDTRIKEQTHTAGIKYKLHWNKNAVYEGTNECFTDKEFHSYLNKLGIKREDNTEWFQIDPDSAKNDFNEFRENKGFVEDNNDPSPYNLRNEQENCVKKTIEYFQSHENGEFLWNAKPRFGKTLSAYDLCMKMGFKNILIVTNRPAIANSWYEDYEKFIGANSGYYFVSRVDSLKNKKFVLTRKEYTDRLGIDENLKGNIEFVSLQDIKGSKYFGGDPTSDKLSELSNHIGKDGKQIGITWDILIIDEAHEGVDTYKTDVAFDHISRKNTLHLSGTPFKALANDKFSDDAIYNWTYADEQKAKHNWDNSNEEENPYSQLPQLNLFTYKMSDIVRDKIEEGIEIEGDVKEFAFDLNEFFSTNESGRFIYEYDVDKFLDALVTLEKFPFSTEDLRNEIKHSFWILNRVDSAKALGKKLREHPIFRDYEIIIAAGDGRLDDEAVNEKAYDQVVNAIKKYDKTITLSVGQLTTGITIPEWTAVLMLSNMKSPSLYMQAAFRAQNPCLFNDGNKMYRKKNAYVFDFDPARTLTIFEEFANDLSQYTSGGRGDTETRKKQIKELLNFFPVFGEDPNGSMVLLDAEKVLTIPRKIHATEVVNHGFMSNFLFANIGNIFSAPDAVKKIIDKFDAIKENKKYTDLNNSNVEELNLDENNEVTIPIEDVEKKTENIFGDKVYKIIENSIKTDQPKYTFDSNATDTNNLKSLKQAFTDPVTETLIDVAKESYGKDLKKSTQRDLENKLNKTTEQIVNKEYGSWKIETNLLESKRKEEVQQASSSEEVTSINEKYNDELSKKTEELFANIREKFKQDDVLKKSGETIVETVEKEKKNDEKHEIENSVRDHLRGFARTIPSFLMAYGSEDVTLDSFDKIVPNDVFLEVTSITLDQFRFLRDGGEYYDEEAEETKHFDGQLFDEIVFNDSVIEFLNKKTELSNYFDENIKKDIFDYIPPQKTNQIFTPKKIVKEMVDMLEEENPGCFDNPDKTFIDLYMKSGLYITEIVKRLYRSEKIKKMFPDDQERLNHIFANQVFGLAPTEIIYRIAINYILGFSDKINIEKHNLRKLDSLKCIQDGNLEEKLDEIF